MFPQAQQLLRTGLLSCALLLGLQFVVPHALHATDHLVLLEEGVVPPLVQEEEGSGPGGDEDHLTIAFGPEFLHSLQLQQSGYLVQRAIVERPLAAFLRASGLQPSAP